MAKKLHPSVVQFKEFVQQNPTIINEVRQGTTTWQELYEEWYLLGEDDPRWDSFRNNGINKKKQNTEGEKGSDLVGQIWNRVKKMDPQQFESHISSLSEALGAVQGLLSSFQASKPNSSSPQPNSSQPNPFSFRKD